MLTFEQAYEFTDKVSSNTAYELRECRLLFNIAMRIPVGGTIIEIGCEYGRSTSILMQVAKEKSAEVHLVEPDPKPELLTMLRSLHYPFILHVSKSIDAIGIPTYGDFGHIDGDHEFDAVYHDLGLLTRIVKGYIVCHDYKRESLPDVTRAIDEFRAANKDKIRLNDFAETALCMTTL
jgi:hypothetical protein